LTNYLTLKKRKPDMAVYDLEEQEKIDDLKTWWRLRGRRLAWVLLAAVIVAVSWLGWKEYQNRQSLEASVLFGSLQQALSADNAQQVRSIAGELTEKYAGTAYAPLAMLTAAKVSFEAGDAKTARTQLSWLIERDKGELGDIARLRLAGVMLDEKAYDEALQELAHQPGDAWIAAYAELRGDILAAQDKTEDARAAYKAALEALEKDAKRDAAGNVDESRDATQALEMPAVQLLRHKLDALGEA
jgi:predicted negative regulator of RcsB-dependent stress response